MTRWLRYLQLDKLSFWIGFLTATLFWWFFGLIRPFLRRLWENIKEGMQTARQGLQTGTEQRHRNDTLKYAQGIHLAAPLFSLDEILIAPRLMAPPPMTVPDEPPPADTVVSMAIPYAPDWPEMASAYSGHTLDPLQVLQEDVNLAIIGPPGSGKTTTLAYIATKIARQSPEAGKLENHLPIFAHAADFDFSQTENKTNIQIILDAISFRASALTLTRLPDLVKNAIQHGLAFLIIDGLDELAPDRLGEIVGFLKNFLQEYSHIRIVVAAAPDHLDGLPALGFAPVPMAIWDTNQQAQFVQKWSGLWEKFIADKLTFDAGYIDPLLLNGWLLNMNTATTPLEFTLKVWAVYAGDARGPRRSDALEAYIQRMSFGIRKAKAGLEQLAGQVVLTQEIAFTQRDTSTRVSEDESAEDDEFEILAIPSAEGDSKTQVVAIHRSVQDLAQRGLLLARANHKLSFVHPMVAGYLAGEGFSKTGSAGAFSQPSWLLRDLAIQFMAAHVTLENQVKLLLANVQDPVYRDALTAGRWLQEAPKDAAWRKPILQQFSGDLQKESFTMGLRLRILSALATSGDPGVQTLFRHLLKSQQSSVRQLAALGCGFTRDLQAVGDLVRLLGDVIDVGRAACLALVKIGTKPALEAVASVFLEGTEEMRRAAAETFATHPSEGHPALREGMLVDDILVRRAVIYGLKRVNQPWALEILEETQIEDAQWVVKNAAQQAVEELKNPDPHNPKPLMPLEDTPWLIEFASNLGVGISAGEAARDMLLRALKDGNPEQQLAALGQIQRRGETRVFPAVYHLIYGQHPDVSEMAFNTLWQIASTDAEIPPPIQFGLG
jgi:HEAT repeat protein